MDSVQAVRLLGEEMQMGLSHYFIGSGPNRPRQSRIEPALDLTLS